MKPVRKQFDVKQSLFPFYLAYRDSKSPQHELPDHVHEWYEIVIIHRGKGTFFIDQTFYDVKEGDIFIIPSNTIHRAIPDETNLITSTAIFFSPVLIQQASFGDPSSYYAIFNEARTIKNYKYSLRPDHQNQLNESIDKLVAEFKSENQNRENAIILWLHLILLDLYRNRLQKSTYNKSPLLEPEWMTEILAFINKNLNGRLDLNFLAKRISISPAHFSRTFKILLGMNVSDYIIEKRINLAKEKLKNENEKISTISKQCGFNSMPHFYRTFKKQTSMTPSEYRRKTI
ncbi:AraC family transcriptional regulator [Halalkalibacter kiskunsagensis]|uniref:AraC family transcriptional regulator n=1 Tax=Halalkalibacter kiskunsagensis TaxID=1548599 RepID=A0ABV6KBH3_9BACI